LRRCVPRRPRLHTTVRVVCTLLGQSGPSRRSNAGIEPARKFRGPPASAAFTAPYVRAPESGAPGSSTWDARVERAGDLARKAGLEPTTAGFGDRCATNCATSARTGLRRPESTGQGLSRFCLCPLCSFQTTFRPRGALIGIGVRDGPLVSRNEKSHLEKFQVARLLSAIC